MDAASDFLAKFASPAFRHLRPLQAEALKQLQSRSDGDLALAMPTGSGKTLVALLMAAEVLAKAESAVYLTGTIHLSRQVLDEAAKLGLDADAMAAPLSEISARRISRVEMGRTLAIANYWAYFSDRQLFAPPGLLIIDDAHLLEGALLDRYAIDISLREQPGLLQRIYEVISERAPGYQVVDDVVSGVAEPSSVPQLIAFPHVVESLEPVRRILDESASTADYRWAYSRIGAHLAQCLWLAGPDSLLIRPLRFPIHGDERFAAATRRLFMSATMGDLADLRRRLGTEWIEPVDLSATQTSSTGRRYLVLADNPSDAGELIAARDRLVAATPRRVWFCRSHREADQVAAEQESGGHLTMRLSRLGEEMDAFASGTDVDMVLSGRYDGIDFAGDLCRLAFFPSAPYGTDPLDEFMTAHFGRTAFLRARVADRLTQALGRMTRSPDDWAVVVLEDPRIVRLLVQRDVATFLPDDLWAEIEDGLDRAGRGTDDVLAEAAAVLAGSVKIPPRGDWRRPAGERPLWPRERSDMEARFGDALFAGTFDGAIPAATRVLDSLGDHPLRPWWLYLRAMAAYLSALQDAQPERLAAALVDAEAAVRAAGRTAWFARVEASLAVIRQRQDASAGGAAGVGTNPLVATLQRFTSRARYEEWKSRISAGLRSGDHQQTVAAWTEIGRALGYAASQPAGQAATDSLWRGPDGSFVFEAKIEHGPDAELMRRDVTQLLGQIEQESQTGNAVLGSFLTPVSAYHEAAQPIVDRISVLPVAVAEAIWLRLEALLDRCSTAISAGHRTTAFRPPDGWLHGLLADGRGRFISEADLDSVWPRQA